MILPAECWPGPGTARPGSILSTELKTRIQHGHDRFGNGGEVPTATNNLRHGAHFSYGSSVPLSRPAKNSPAAAAAAGRAARSRVTVPGLAASAGCPTRDKFRAN
jgi:hypothetical protein